MYVVLYGVHWKSPGNLFDYGQNVTNEVDYVLSVLF